MPALSDEHRQILVAARQNPEYAQYWDKIDQALAGGSAAPAPSQSAAINPAAAAPLAKHFKDLMEGLSATKAAGSAAQALPLEALATAPAENAAWNAAATQAGGGLNGAGLLGGIGPAGLAAGAYTGGQQLSGASDFIKGEKLKTPQKLALALPTFGLSLFSDTIQDTFGLGGNRTKNTELNRLKDLQKGGYVDEEFVNAIGRPSHGVSGINPNADYEAALGRGDSEQEAGRKKDYAELIKSKKFEDAENLLTGEDLWGYSDVVKTISDITGVDYIKGLSESQRRDAAQAIADHNRKSGGKTIEGDKGTYKINSDDELTQIIKNIGLGGMVSATPSPSRGGRPTPGNLPNIATAGTQETVPGGGVGGPGYEPDPDRPGHFKKKRY